MANAAILIDGGYLLKRLPAVWQDISPDLFEHIDGLRSGFFKPKRDNVHQGRDLTRTLVHWWSGSVVPFPQSACCRLARRRRPCVSCRDMPSVSVIAAMKANHPRLTTHQRLLDARSGLFDVRSSRPRGGLRRVAPAIKVISTPR